LGTSLKPAIVPEARQWEQAWTSGAEPPPAVHEKLIGAIAGCMDIRGKRILEVGSGTGYDSVHLATLGAEVYALDLTATALRLTRATSGEHDADVRLVVGDTLCLPFQDGAFDLVFSQGLLEHFSDPRPVVREQARVVAPGGYLVVDVPQRYSLYTLHKRRQMKAGRWFAGWESEFSLRELTGILEAEGLRRTRSYGYGYFPALLYGVRHLHTLDQRRAVPFRVPGALRTGVERVWEGLEGLSWYFRWMTNIGVVARKVPKS
jgi:SAM-dependent methyltransferase